MISANTCSAALEFLHTLHPDDDNLTPSRRLLIWTQPDKRSYWFTDLAAAAEFISAHTDDDVAIYFGLGLAPADLGPRRRCLAREVTAIPGFGVDLDVAGPAHDKPGLPPTKEEARRILPTDFPPSIVIDTGHGLQAYWLLRELWIFDSDEERDAAAALALRLQRWIEMRAAAFAYVVDAVHDLSRVFRMVGTFNRKVPGDARPVQIIDTSGRRYNPSDLQEILDLAGVPEREIRSVDADGRVEYGGLRVDPRVELTPTQQARLEALRTNDPDFDAAWTRKKRMRRDNSWSGIAQSIANSLAVAGFGVQEIIDILTLHRRDHGDPGKRGSKPLSWFVNPYDPTKGTVAKAMAFAQEQAAKEKRRQQRAAREEEDAQQAQRVAEVEQLTPEQVRARIRELYKLDVERLVQVGTGHNPAFRLELQDKRSIEFPTLTSVSSFDAFRKHLWLGTGRMLSPSARRHWPEVATLLARLKHVDDVGAGSSDVLLYFLAAWLANARHLSPRYFKELREAGAFEPGPVDIDKTSTRTGDGILFAATPEEFVVALKLITLPQGHPASATAACLPITSSDEVIRLVFKMPPFVDYLRRLRGWTIMIEELVKLLHAAGFRYKDSTSIARMVADAGAGQLANRKDNLRLRQVWFGWVTPAAIDTAEALTEGQRQNAYVDERIRRSKEEEEE